MSSLIYDYRVTQSVFVFIWYRSIWKYNIGYINFSLETLVENKSLVRYVTFINNRWVGVITVNMYLMPCSLVFLTFYYYFNILENGNESPMFP